MDGKNEQKIQKIQIVFTLVEYSRCVYIPRLFFRKAKDNAINETN